MIDKFLSFFKEYLKVQNTHESNEFPVVQIQREILSSLNKIIDARIKFHDKSLPRDTVQDLPPLTTSIDESLIPFINALNCAPIPPSNFNALSEKDTLRWLEAYGTWFYGQRKKVMSKF